jgi:tRNA-dihydrouridine synthase
MFTEFVSADGLMSEGREKLLVDLLYSESERPIVAQLFSGNPEKMFRAARLVKKLGFDGLDINMGCPDRSIEKSGAGAALIKNSSCARELIRAAKRGADPLPISIKTRLGYDKDILEEWLPRLLAEEPAAITIHARTRKEMSNAPAHWARVKRAVEIRDTLFSLRSRISPDTRPDIVKTLILGNGDVASIAEAEQKVKETGADGIMLGRAIFGNPFLFAHSHEYTNEKRLEILVEHTKLFTELLGKYKSFSIMKKHFKAYIQGFDGAKELRMRLMETENAAQVEKIITDFLRTLQYSHSPAFSGEDIDNCP